MASNSLYFIFTALCNSKLNTGKWQSFVFISLFVNTTIDSKGGQPRMRGFVFGGVFVYACVLLLLFSLFYWLFQIRKYYQ